ncbi:amino acid ABC transporter permease [Clostridium cellulovorans]|uniref:Polar amino acid ABC transporter, inner membrane subunit n=1 Tax=Clostridium cellulovorans (strain ATCC 35296 / DSM 3052 / OCM 3 / 743B) TaxID=573061 RepID=D9SVT7_CLOC7|nr:amino acid ABC transporter permease [Clostridium cellulovorans]ADL53148.1 polar amino acid ABC transporter, inner membrane subunit [Clostridium cellulovorans 743B]
MQDLGASIIFQGVNLQRLLSGLLVTGRIALISIAISSILGIIFGIIMTSKRKSIKIFSRLYLESIRIIPILVLLFIFYFGITKILKIHLEGELGSIIVFSLWGTAEMGDLVRGAIMSLPKHQRESGKAIGLTENQIYLYIIIPQVVRRLVPAAMNLATRMIKTTSLVVLIGVVEVLKVSQQIIESSVLKNPSAAFWVYGFCFILYFIICYPMSLFSKRLEKKWQS